RLDEGGAGEVDDARPQPLHARAEPGGQHLLELAQRPLRRLADAVDVAARGGGERDRGGHRLVAEELQRGQPAAVAEPIAAALALDGVDRVVELAELVDVPAQGADADAE